ncbi:unnamed protein product, partial [Symbiodinium sp. CCMP2592]
ALACTRNGLRSRRAKLVEQAWLFALCCDATPLVSSITGASTSHPRAGHTPGVALRMAKKRNRATHPELQHGGGQRFFVIAAEVFARLERWLAVPGKNVFVMQTDQCCQGIGRGDTAGIAGLEDHEFARDTAKRHFDAVSAGCKWEQGHGAGHTERSEGGAQGRGSSAQHHGLLRRRGRGAE